MAPNKGKLSKRKHGEVVSMTTYRDAGFLAAAFRNFLALLGWSASEEQEIYSLDELVQKFSLAGIHRSNAVFNFKENDPRHWTDDKAIWMNAEYIRTMPLDQLLPFVKAELKSAKLWREEYDEEGVALSADIPSTADLGPDGRPEAVALEHREVGSRDWLIYALNLIRQRFFTLKDFSAQGRAYFSEDFDFDPAAVAKNLTKFPELKTWLPELADRFETEFGVSSPHVSKGSHAYTEANIETVVKAFTEEKDTKLGVIMNGARTLLTGVAVGPSMLSVFEIIGLERTVM
jgi:glutamyl-tRNA synthetase